MPSRASSNRISNYFLTKTPSRIWTAKRMTTVVISGSPQILFTFKVTYLKILHHDTYLSIKINDRTSQNESVLDLHVESPIKFTNSTSTCMAVAIHCYHPYLLTILFWSYAPHWRYCRNHTKHNDPACHPGIIHSQHCHPTHKEDAQALTYTLKRVCAKVHLWAGLLDYDQHILGVGPSAWSRLYLPGMWPMRWGKYWQVLNESPPVHWSESTNALKFLIHAGGLLVSWSLTMTEVVRLNYFTGWVQTINTITLCWWGYDC